MLLICWVSCTALERTCKSACYRGCCFAKAPEIVAPSVRAAKLLKPPEVWQNTICNPQMCSGESIPHIHKLQQTVHCEPVQHLLATFKEESCLPRLLVFDGGLKKCHPRSLSLCPSAVPTPNINPDCTFSSPWQKDPAGKEAPLLHVPSSPTRTSSCRWGGEEGLAPECCWGPVQNLFQILPLSSPAIASSQKLTHSGARRII